MIIVMKQDASDEQIQNVVSRLEAIGSESHVSNGQFRTVIGALGDRELIQQLPWEAFEGVERAVPVLKPFKFVSRDFQADDTVINVRNAQVGGGVFAPIAGPCAVETRDQLFQTAEAVKKAGATILRGDAFKPRTSPYSFQGLGEEGLIMLAEAREEFDLPFVAEVLDPRHVDMIGTHTHARARFRVNGRRSGMERISKSGARDRCPRSRSTKHAGCGRQRGGAVGDLHVSDRGRRLD